MTKNNRFAGSPVVSSGGSDEDLVRRLAEKVQERKRVSVARYLRGVFPDFNAQDMGLDPVGERVEYQLEELLFGSDAVFVTCAYRALLKREPDFEGMQSQMAALAGGTFTRLQLLESFRYSQEGMAHAVLVRGLRAAFYRERCARLPIIGPLLAAVSNLALLRNWDADTEFFENPTAASDAQLNDLASRLVGRTQLPPAQAAELAASTVTLGKVLGLPCDSLVRLAYLRARGREPSSEELADGEQALFSGSCTRTGFLAKQCQLAGVSVDSIGVAGLPRAARRDRLLSTPVLGFLLRLPRLLYLLSRLDRTLESQRVESCNHMGEFYRDFSAHYNASTRDMREAIAEMLVVSDSEGSDEGSTESKTE